jgi:hypothetical protein
MQSTLYKNIFGLSIEILMEYTDYNLHLGIPHKAVKPIKLKITNELVER